MQFLKWKNVILFAKICNEIAVMHLKKYKEANDDKDRRGQCKYRYNTVPIWTLDCSSEMENCISIHAFTDKY